ncbi:YidB family protein [Paenalcaligenes niemegkensis]|uniref:YidB family protein n=1 Tax=Paenalcaligenes niemegkensis TaxID=2895469 RepID=UPI001EE8C20B|nr:YidB family protein [Paenalcaligenes niemegkensis]MCQ9615351.1 YidB family protein [Paenalcaligenes niemegkensis]
MSIFNSLKTVASTAFSPVQQERASLVPALVSAVKGYPGGVAGLVAAFNQGGLATVVSSWMSREESLPVNADQLQSVLGTPMISDMAEHSGLSSKQVLSHLPTLLPILMRAVGATGDMKSLDTQALLESVLKLGE